MKLQNKVALITGSSKGIGKAIALKFASEGANIAINYNNSYKEAQDVLSEVLKYGIKAITIGADVSKEEDCKRLVETTIKELGGLDILVNNVGEYIDGDDWAGEFNAWEKTFQINLLSVLSVSKYAIKNFIENKSGTIINISSRYSVSGVYDGPAYSAAKAGIVNITQGQAKLLLPFGTANAISPGAANSGYWITTNKQEIESELERIPNHTFVEPSEIADVALMLATTKSITAQNILMDGGYTLAQL